MVNYGWALHQFIFIDVKVDLLTSCNFADVKFKKVKVPLGDPSTLFRRLEFSLFLYYLFIYFFYIGHHFITSMITSLITFKEAK